MASDNSSDQRGLNEEEATLLTFKKAPTPLEDVETQTEEVESRFRRRAIKLDDIVKKNLEQDLYDKIVDWRDSRSSLNRKLKDLNDLAEGVVTVTDFPWKGASNIHVPMPKIKLRELRSTINRTVLRPVPFLMAQYAGPNELYQDSRGIVKDIEDFVEDKIKNDTNVHEKLKEGVAPTIRDGTSVPQIVWETELERVTDFKLYTSPEDFANDYPSAEDAGISSSKYSEIVKALANGGKYEIQFEMDQPVYDGPKAYLVGLNDFVHWPTYVNSVPDMLLHGKRIYYTDYQIEEYGRIGRFVDEEDVDFVIKMEGDLRKDDGLTTSRDNIEGINRNQFKSREYECFELIYRKDLDEDGIKEKYLIVFALNARKILRIEKYPIRRGKSNYFPTWLIKRDNRFLGISLLDDISDLSLEIDIVHRQRINSRTISHVPSFKAKTKVKNLFDPSREDLRFSPGVTFYLDDLEDVKQFDIRPVDLSGSVDEEQLLYQLIDLVTGSSSGLSGQSNPLDPRAPARKQAELLRQSTNRIDDYVDTLLGTYSQIGQFILDLYYQYGPDRIKYYVRNEGGAMIEKEIDRSRLYNPNLRFIVNGTSVFMNPDSEFARNQEIAQLIMTNPVTAQNPRILREMLIRLLESARVKDDKSLIPTREELAKMTGGEDTLLPTEQDKELQAKAKIAQEKIASRTAEGEAKRKHDAELALLDTAQQLHDQSLQAPPAPVPAEAAVPAPPTGVVPGALPTVNPAEVPLNGA